MQKSIVSKDYKVFLRLFRAAREKAMLTQLDDFLFSMTKVGENPLFSDKYRPRYLSSSLHIFFVRNERTPILDHHR